MRAARRRVRRLAERATASRTRAELAALGLHHITEVWPEDVVIVRYPKSGSTWFGALVAGVVHGVDIGLSPPSLLMELVPGMHSATYYRRFHTPMYFKSHNLPTPRYRRVIYILRDGRDAMVSYYHHLRALAGDKVPDDDFLQIVKYRDRS